ncbi:hypothetical protein CsatA_025959 [Cannabis sativa]
MMEINVEVVSKEIIKPSSPTSSHLRTYHLSFLDQISRHVYNPFVLFYQNHKNLNNHNLLHLYSTNIKKSLSNLLSRYHLFAGRLKQTTVDCNDEGIPYFEAKINCKLSDFLQNPDPQQLHKFIPFELNGLGLDLLLGLQFNLFNCDGIAIGICISHKVADAISCLLFIKNLAATTRGCTDDDDDDHQNKIVWPKFESAKLFPPKEASALGRPGGVVIPTLKIVTRRFVFGSDKIESLRAKYQEEDGATRRPSRVETLSAFITSRFMAALKVGFGDDKRRLVIGHAFNLRKRVDPPLEENSFGNIARPFVKVLSSNNISDVMSQMRELIVSGDDKEHAKSLQKEGIDPTLNFFEQHADELMKGELVCICFTSICRFPLYVDFGWGKPSWVATNPFPYKNFVVLADSRLGGIEAYIDMEEEDMVKFQNDQEFLSFVSDPYITI